MKAKWVFPLSHIRNRNDSLPSHNISLSLCVKEKNVKNSCPKNNEHFLFPWLSPKRKNCRKTKDDSQGSFANPDAQKIFNLNENEKKNWEWLYFTLGRLARWKVGCWPEDYKLSQMGWDKPTYCHSLRSKLIALIDVSRKAWFTPLISIGSYEINFLIMLPPRFHKIDLHRFAD